MSYTLGSAAEFGVRHRPTALHRSKYWDKRVTEVIVGETEFRKFKLRKLFEASNVVADDEADGQELVQSGTVRVQYSGFPSQKDERVYEYCTSTVQFCI